MTPHMQNPGVQAGVSRDLIGISSRKTLTAPDWRWQQIAIRFWLSSEMAKEVSRHCYGEARDD
ncbi:hypothetical protein [Aurantiacibacter rhizosphaerae]|uniref:Uncharacterized protein n=1 Tax=Aurantiacibacter rhizosphaerae TaxID=2691582 RepID=A0A844X9D2_9SPHN|nr:hypothetical protein [Aurantiacibacter rhizosphaerae]MWV26440.1 hypothetical protein [Aurantiacibacter rhizosphaerae]